MNYVLAIGLAAVAALTGCASTTPTPKNEVVAAPAARIVAFALPTPNAGRLVVTRDAGFIGGACFYSIWLNGELAARLDQREQAMFYVPAGEVRLKAARDPQGAGLCSGLSDVWSQRETQIAKGEVKHFRLGIDSEGRPDVMRAD